MPYTKPIRRDCDYGACTRDATVEVFNDRNASCGQFCSYHGQQKVKQLADKSRPKG